MATNYKLPESVSLVSYDFDKKHARHHWDALEQAPFWVVGGSGSLDHSANQMPWVAVPAHGVRAWFEVFPWIDFCYVGVGFPAQTEEESKAILEELRRREMEQETQDDLAKAMQEAADRRMANPMEDSWDEADEQLFSCSQCGCTGESGFSVLSDLTLCEDCYWPIRDAEIHAECACCARVVIGPRQQVNNMLLCDDCAEGERVWLQNLDQNTLNAIDEIYEERPRPTFVSWIRERIGI